jgi:hypothetical protein
MNAEAAVVRRSGLELALVDPHALAHPDQAVAGAVGRGRRGGAGRGRAVANLDVE